MSKFVYGISSQLWCLPFRFHQSKFLHSMRQRGNGKEDTSVDAYCEETLTDGNGKEDTRVVMKFHPALAPFKAAVLPLAKKLAPVAVSLSRMVTHPSASVSKSTQMQNGVPISSSLLYLFPIDPAAS